VAATARRLRFIVQYGRQSLDGIRPVESSLARHNFVKNAAKREDVGSGIDALAAHLLRCHVPDRAKNGPVLRGTAERGRVSDQRAGDSLLARQAEIEHLDAPALRQLDVLRF